MILPPEEQAEVRERLEKGDRDKDSNPDIRENYEAAKSQAIQEVTDRFSEYWPGMSPDGFKTDTEDVVDSVSSQVKSAVEDGELDSESANKLWQEAIDEISSQVSIAYYGELQHSEMDEDAGPEWERKSISAKKKVDSFLAKQKKRKF